MDDGTQQTDWGCNLVTSVPALTFHRPMLNRVFFFCSFFLIEWPSPAAYFESFVPLHYTVQMHCIAIATVHVFALILP